MFSKLYWTTYSGVEISKIIQMLSYLITYVALVMQTCEELPKIPESAKLICIPRVSGVRFLGRNFAWRCNELRSIRICKGIFYISWPPEFPLLGFIKNPLAKIFFSSLLHFLGPFEIFWKDMVTTIGMSVQFYVSPEKISFESIVVGPWHWI